MLSVLLAPSGENQGIWKPKANLSVLRPEVPMPSLRGGSDETLLLLWVVFAAPCRLVGPGKLEEKEMDELRTKCWQMRKRSLGSMSLLRSRLGRLPFSKFLELGSSKGEALWAVTQFSSKQL